MGILSTLLRAATWWNGQTLNTQLYTWRYGQRVGDDAQGNVFFQSKDGKRRWVIFNGEAEASRIGAEWHGWLHHTYQEPPTERPMTHKVWEKPHQENLTGTAQAYVPAGSIRRPVPVERSDYEAWRPE
ncbi:NADH:ubiquinone oxidoreductase subunit NDUFA12 [Puniceibacterium confluentis]|uniref:NADH:ubiquinone oxidoreductase subunit NDUFA12 n=1 Tax=Puniceibacterium confluentis TaxID=1958944 RepID=UPI0011B5512E|nr:NADH:ubiquinone oxidoreductase subunit NDUFA12 [Puniceibacterium confluentis]